MPERIKVTEQKLVVVEACGTRKAIGETVFEPMEGFIGDCAEMDKEEAEILIRGEALTEKYKEKLRHLKKGETISPDEQHGKHVNFRYARKKKVGVK